jgi:acetyl esterase/lipase
VHVKRAKGTRQAEIGTVYGEVEGERLLLDVYSGGLPDGVRPAVMLIHGGGMWTGSRADMAGPAQELARAGYVAVSIDYRLVDAGTGRNRWPAQLDDAQRAVRWLRANAGRFGIDPGRIGAYGWSAGGQLAALLGVRDTRIDDDPSLTGCSSRVSCVVDLAGDVDLAAYTLPPTRDEVEALLGGTPESAPARYCDVSPLTWVDAMSAPFLIVHGLADDVVPIEQSRRLAAALRTAKVEVAFVELPQAGHGDLIDNWSLTADQTLAFLKLHLRA